MQIIKKKNLKWKYRKFKNLKLMMLKTRYYIE